MTLRHPKSPRIDVITMGCSKNLIDSERLMRALELKGYDPHHDAPDAGGGIAVVNTCGFIGDAKKESIEMILSLAEAKSDGRISALYVMGCLSERYRAELQAEIPEVDRWYGKFDWKQMLSDLPDVSAAAAPALLWDRTLTTPPWSAYLKISEGCDRRCAYCAIPIITGRHTSRPMEEILEEARRLADSGVRELNVIAQDLSSYGFDLYRQYRLPELVDALADVGDIDWIRLHYAYPAGFPMPLLDVMAARDNVCKYLDIALQHISDPVLTNMRRHISREETLRLIDTIRFRVPGIKLRTTLMVGFPGEGEKEFDELIDFVRAVRFERMGAFAYCEEEDTYAARHFADSIPQEVKQSRLDTLMDVQQDISAEIHADMVGSVQRVLIDRLEGETAVGRTQWDSPEVDPETIVADGASLAPGSFVDVRITGSGPYELQAERLS